MAPTNTGRIIAGFIGLAIGGGVTYYLTKDFQLIKFTPATPNPDGTFPPKKVSVTFREMQPLELTPEAQKKREQNLAARAKKNEIEQIIQEPTS
ncbi:unnamed protein product [Cyberlindnera jadinii]|uniref:Uncharacterized protein n=1 Tax=Cyberlindnera jadinii (strain ATCC 18201 / CBS 1600 / BCRC 20928 / JCM 3617 / NBRC 0987 / NRRL Y-1542) TaxID=983966 RepID=A0A0H5C5X5_CYBJN|nr:unnamed protein product [Cyberlindnera jadinii]